MSASLADAPGYARVSARIAAYVVAADLHRVPPEVADRACDLMLDAIGCGIAALGEPFVRQTVDSVSALAGAGPRGVLGSPSRLPMRDAAMLNGLIMHGLDYDDTHTDGVVHLTVSVLPTVLAVAGHTGASGRAMLEACIAGIEVGARLAAAARGGFHRHGWHPTGLVGTFASAVAAGRLLGLDAARLAHAQGIALSLAGGSLQFLDDGAWTKRLHPGWAAQAGITAAWLARDHFPGPLEAYEGRFGLYRLHLADATAALEGLAASLPGLGADGRATPWELPRVAVKPYPACHLLHGATEAAITLHRQGIDTRTVRRVLARVPADAVAVVCEPLASKRRPRTDYEAKFSLPYAVATGLLRGRLGLADLEPGALIAADARQLMDRIEYEVDASTTYPRHYPGEVVVELEDGRRHSARIAVNLGHEERPLTRPDVEEKFFANAGRHASAARARALRDAVRGLAAAPDTTGLEALLTLQPRPELE
jgi:2-methylcitrate dehydratase PrpD